MTLRLFKLCLLALLPQLLVAQPTLYKATSGGGTLYILGGTPVPDEAWHTAAIGAALNESDTLWVEIPPADPEAGVPPLREEVVPAPGRELHPVAREEGYGNLRFGDFMDVAMGERSVVESQRLNLEGSNFRAMQPWLAWFTFHHAFWDQQGVSLVDPAETLVAQARAAGKEVRSLFADRAEYYRFMGRMSDSAQTHFFQTLYNTFDAQRAGEYAKRYGWTTGNPDPSWVERMQTQTPSYYRFMYERRNPAIAEQLQGVLMAGGTHFLYVDIDRLLGPHSLVGALQALGVAVEEL